MIWIAEQIEKPYSGQYFERIYDIQSPWNSRVWTWIKFVDENGEWCGNFRGEYKGVSVSEKLGIVVVVTSDYLFVLNTHTADLMEYESRPDIVDITTSPLGDIFLTNGYGIEQIVHGEMGKIEFIDIPPVPVQPDGLKFLEWNENILKIRCDEFLNWGNEIELYFDCETMEWVERLPADRKVKK